MNTHGEPRLDALMAELAAQSRVGMSITVVRHGRVDVARGFGVRSVADPVPVTADTLFYAASVAKLMTATAVLQLVERGQLRLDARMVDCLPTILPADTRARDITIRHVLTHTSGLPDVEDYGWDAPEYDTDALQRFVRSQASRPLIAAPGVTFAYSNLGYSMLGAIVAAVTGQSFEDYVHREVLAPLGMRRSTFLLPDLADPQTALPHVGVGGPVPAPVYPYHRAHGPSSNFHTTAREMGLWIATHLAQGAEQQRRILREATYQEMWQPAWTLDAQRAVGLGWFLVMRDGTRWAGHGGHDPGFRAICLLAPEAQVGVAVLTNDDAIDTDSVAIALSTAVRASTEQ